MEVKRNVELLEHISEYAFAIRAYHQDAHERAGRGADQLATFKDGLQRRRQEFEKRRREFVELRDQLVALGGEEVSLAFQVQCKTLQNTLKIAAFSETKFQREIIQDFARLIRRFIQLRFLSKRFFLFTKGNCRPRRNC